MLSFSLFGRACLFAACMFGAAAASGQATLVVESVPTGARVEVDGRFVGTTPMSADIAPGRRSVTVARIG